MNGLQIYEIAKQAQWEAEYEAALDSIEFDYAAAPPRRSILARMGEQLRWMLAVTRAGRGEPTRAAE